MTRIYFDNAATTPVTQTVRDAMWPYFTTHFGNPSAIHQDGRTARAALEQARRTVAEHIHAQSAEVVFTSGGTESNNIALKGAVAALGVTRILVNPIEHPCVLNTVLELEKAAHIRVEKLILDAEGRVNLEALEQQLAQAHEGRTLLSVMHANNEIGVLQDLEALGALCKAHDAYFHSDTVQTLGQVPLDVQAMQIDFLTGSAHKLHGPKGVGFLYVKDGLKLPALVQGGGQERQLRSGTENIPGIVGFAQALRDAAEHRMVWQGHILRLKETLYMKLQERLGDVQVNGSLHEGLPKILNVSMPHMERADLMLFQLDMQGVSVSGGSACSAGALEGSHVLRHLKVDQARPSIRFSFSHLNTLEEVERVVDILCTFYEK